MTQLIGRAEIAKKMSVKPRYFRETVEKKPGFPKPKKRLSQKVVLWEERAVDLWIQQDERKAA